MPAYLSELPIPNEGTYEANRDATIRAAEDRAERWGEAAMDRLDRRFMRGEIGQAEYDAAVRAIGSEVSRRMGAELDALGIA